LGIKTPCLIIQAEGTEGVYIIGYRNLLNGKIEVDWITEFELLGNSISDREYKC